MMALLISCAATQALAQDRVKAVSALEQWCEQSALSAPHFVRVLRTTYKVPLPAFCGCIARKLVTGFNGQDIAVYMSTGRYPPTMTILGEMAGKGCVLSLTE
jgi:hypothetical protein